MSGEDFREAAQFIYNDLRLKTFPLAVRFLKEGEAFPEKTRQPTVALGKRIAICQGVTMARNYGWTVGLRKEDVICVPAAIVFGFSEAGDQAGAVTGLFTEINFSIDREHAAAETAGMSRFEKGEIEGILMAPLAKASFEPQLVLSYGNPAQMMRFAQAWSYMTGERVSGEFGGKVECDEYLITPFKTQSPRMVIPGNGERIFAAAQDDEMAFVLPAKSLMDLVKGLKEVGKAMGVRYPVTPYQNYQPDLPKAHKQLGKELGIL
ncbi:MAG: DUF169 domain-containing protein [Syntrophobacteraceae bacterium]